MGSSPPSWAIRKSHMRSHHTAALTGCRYARHTLQIPIEVRIEGSETIVCAETTDLSRNGCYFRLLSPLHVGLRVHATLWLDQVPIQVTRRVVTRHPDLWNRIMFLELQGHSKQALAA